MKTNYVIERTPRKLRGMARREVTYSRTVARAVRDRLAAKRYTQAALAGALDVSQVSISRRLTGEVDFSIAELAAIAALLDCDVPDLLPRDYPGDPVHELLHLDSNQEPAGIASWLDAA